MKSSEPLNPQAIEFEWLPRSQLPAPLIPPFLPQLKLCIPPHYSYVIYPQPQPIFTSTTSPAEETVAISHVQETGESSLGHSGRRSQRRRYLPTKPPPKHSVAAASISSHPRPKKQEWKRKAAAPALPPSSLPAVETTLMIKNIPNRLRRDFMLKFLDRYCREDSLEYDFFYLPIDFRKLGNLGYCFVNLTTPAAAMKLKKKLTNYKWREATVSNKVCDVSWARIQGKEKSIESFEKTFFKCDDPEFLPVIFEPARNGWEQNPPAPVTLGRRIRRR